MLTIVKFILGFDVLFLALLVWSAYVNGRFKKGPKGLQGVQGPTGSISQEN